MSWKLLYYDEVLSDVRDAKKWYAEQQEGLEKRFAKDIKDCINRLKKDPFHYEIRYKQVRLAHCTVFPYSIHFYIQNTTRQIVIIGIVHQHRHPNIAKTRK